MAKTTTTDGRRIGVFGGTFDPIHLGHLILAEQARETLDLHRVLFIPCSQPPHKDGADVTDAKRRLEMVELAVAGNPDFAASDIELSRDAVSYTVETLQALTHEHPEDQFFLLIGADNLAELPTWYQGERIAELATISVACRPGNLPLDLSVADSVLSHDQRAELRTNIVEIPLMEISSTDVRRRVSENCSIRYLVPAPVEAYINAHHLYRD